MPWSRCCTLQSLLVFTLFPWKSSLVTELRNTQAFYLFVCLLQLYSSEKHLYGRHCNNVNGDKLNSLATSFLLILYITYYRTPSPNWEVTVHTGYVQQPRAHKQPSAKHFCTPLQNSEGIQQLLKMRPFMLIFSERFSNISSFILRPLNRKNIWDENRSSY